MGIEQEMGGDDDDNDNNDTDNEDDVLFPPTQTNPTNEGKEHCDTGHGTLMHQPSKRTRTIRRKQADEEYTLIKRLSHSMENRHKRRMVEKNNGTVFDAFGNYVAKALSEFDNQTSHIAQNKISNIIFEAHAGLLTQEYRSQCQPQRHYFQQMVQPAPGMAASSPQPTIYGKSTATYRDDF